MFFNIFGNKRRHEGIKQASNRRHEFYPGSITEPGNPDSLHMAIINKAIKDYKMVVISILFVLFSLLVLSGCSVVKHEQDTFINSLGMEMVLVESGTFIMGNDGEIDYSKVATDAVHARYIGKGGLHPYLEDGPTMAANPLEWDEGPSHRVTISRSFHISSTPVTNKQYEQFDPDHAGKRGKKGFSNGDNEAVLYVSWEDAVAFTDWLSEREGKFYRLPTEAEWEFAARAGSTTPYYMGDLLPVEYHRHQVMNRTHSLAPDSVDLTVGTNNPNNWGIYDVHGIVEEWCLDWYGPYTPEAKTDPVGYVSGEARVTRGGSHSTGLPFLRSASRAGALPETRNFMVGFRVVMGEMPDSNPVSERELPIWARDVCQEVIDLQEIQVPDHLPVFNEPRIFTKIPPDSNGPLYFTHNHNPAVTALPNGDLLAIWFTTVKERGREMTVAGSRLRKGQDVWDEADLFFNIPGRNQSGQALWWDGEKTVYHFGGVSAGDHWRDLSLVMRTSVDNGVTWGKPVIIGPEYGLRHQVIDAVISTRDGEIVLLCDASWDGHGGTVVHISTDNGISWTDPGRGRQLPVFEEGKSGAWIAGIHAGIAELRDGRWMAFGRGNEINGKMPLSISGDKGKTWVYSASSFNLIGAAQRVAFIRLREGPLLLVSFDSALDQYDVSGRHFKGNGMFAALSYDEGESWAVKKLITPGDKRYVLTAPCNLRWGERFSILDTGRAESRGYLTATQSPDGMIHVLSSGTHYSFNLAWLLQPPGIHPVENITTLDEH